VKQFATIFEVLGIDLAVIIESTKLYCRSAPSSKEKLANIDPILMLLGAQDRARKLDLWESIRPQHLSSAIVI
jgi:hypothetical protein